MQEKNETKRKDSLDFEDLDWKEIFKNTYLWEEIKNDQNYQDIANDEDLILSECHARITGKIADQILDKILTEMENLQKIQ